MPTIESCHFSYLPHCSKEPFLSLRISAFSSMFSLLAPPGTSSCPTAPLRGIHPSHSFSPDLHPTKYWVDYSSFCKMIQKNPNFLINPILTFCNSFLIQTFPPFSFLYPLCYPLTSTTTFLSFNSHNISSHFLS